MDGASDGSGLLHKVVGSSFADPQLPATGGDRAAAPPREFERMLAAVVERFGLISKLDELYSDDVARGLIAYDPADEAIITELYREWRDGAEGVAVRLREFRAGGMTFALADSFEALLQDARGICTPDEVFFSGPAFRALEQSAIDAFRAGETVEFEEMED